MNLGLASLAAQESPAAQAAEIVGFVRDAAGRPLASVTVSLQQPGDSHSKQTETDSAGSFSFSRLPAGTYSIKLVKAGFRDAPEESIPLSASEKKHCEFMLRSAAAAPPSSILEASEGFALDDKPNFTVAGVTDSTGSGGHAAETRLRTGEALAKETLRLKGDESAPKTGSEAAEGNDDLTATREHLKEMLAKQTGLNKQGEADLHRMLGDIDEKSGDPLSAVQEYERAAELDSSEQNYFAWASELLLHRAASPAAEVFKKGAGLYPGSARMLAGLGAAMFTSGFAEDAAQRLCQAADLEPANPAPYLFLGKMQEGTSSSLPCVEGKLARFAAEQPSNAFANYYYALALWKGTRASGNPEAVQRARLLFRKASAIDPKVDVAYLQLGNLEYAQTAYPAAIAAYKKAIAGNPDGSEAHYRLGLAYKRAGQQGQAQTEFDKYKQLDKNESEKVERQRRELRQFLFVLKDQQTDSHPKSDVAPDSK